MLRMIALLLVFIATAQAQDNSQRFGNVLVHYSVLNSEFLSPDIAKRYGIKRGGNQGFVNINVQQVNSNSGEGKAIKASIAGKFKNLRSQEDTLAFKEFKEGNAIYYIATFRFDNNDTLMFDLDVTAENSKKANKVKFKQEMYTSR